MLIGKSAFHSDISFVLEKNIIFFNFSGTLKTYSYKQFVVLAIALLIEFHCNHCLNVKCILIGDFGLFI